jgi:hypothetical protein
LACLKRPRKRTCLKAVSDNADALAKANEEIEKAKAKPPADEDDDGRHEEGPRLRRCVPHARGHRHHQEGRRRRHLRGAQEPERPLVKTEADLAKARDADEERSFAKRAEDIGCYGADFGPTLRKAYNGDAAPRSSSRSRSRPCNKQVDEGDLFKSFGSQPAGSGFRDRGVHRQGRRGQEGPPEPDRGAGLHEGLHRPANRDREADEGRTTRCSNRPLASNTLLNKRITPMSTFGTGLTEGGNLVANADLSAKQFYAVKQTTTARKVDVASTGGEAITGILQNTPKAGEAVEVCYSASPRPSRHRRVHRWRLAPDRDRHRQAHHQDLDERHRRGCDRNVSRGEIGLVRVDRRLIARTVRRLSASQGTAGPEQ